MSSITSTSTVSSTSTSSAYAGFTSDEFIQIMLTELTNQDPLEPSKTSDMVVNLREVQSLLTSQQEARRNDLSWGNELVGQDVTVSQSLLTNAEYAAYVEDGLNPDVGASSVTGTVTGFRVVDDAVWVTVGDYDYPIANVTSLHPDTAGTLASTLAELGVSLSGRTVQYTDSAGSVSSGVVTAVYANDDGDIMLSIGDEDIPFENLRSVS